MTDSMKFGPEWLRNLSTDSSLANNIGGSTVNSSGNNNHQVSNSSASFSASATARNMFPEFRYGREEMLSLFDKNCNMPEILPLYKKICVEKVQIPLALTPTTEDEVVSPSPTAPTQRPLWMQRSPLGFPSAVRGMGRGGSVERGRMRGKSTYHPTFQRSQPMFEDDGRPGLPKSERSWYERNGSGDTSVGPNTASGAIVGNVGSDWNGATGSPHTSPRREFSNHTRNMENWRRNRNEDGAGEPSTEGWRHSSGTQMFGGMHRWGRSTSWRDEETPQVDVAVPGALTSSSSTIMQRSYSTISTTVSGANAPQKGVLNGTKVFSRGTPQPNLKNQWTIENGTKGPPHDGEDNLPEWATDLPLGGGGSFDASGAFLGSNVDDTGSENSGAIDLQHNKTDDSSSEMLKTTDIDPKSYQENPEEGEKVVPQSSADNEPDTEPNVEISEASPTKAIDQPLFRQRLDPNIAHPTGERRLSDHMIEAADDMVKKLINDDDPLGNGSARNLGSYTSTPSTSRPSLDNSILSSIHGSSSNLANVNSMALPKNVPYFSNIDQHQFQSGPIVRGGGGEIPAPLTAGGGNDLWYYRDPQLKVQGPFTPLEMTEWYRAGYFNESLLVKRACDNRFRILGDLIKTSQNNMPFTHSSLLGALNMEPEAMTHKDQSEELKGNVTAAADTLSAAVKNMSSVDMLQMLTVRFQMLQEQYIRRLEIAILNELSKNEAFHRLSPAERDALVRQKAQLHGLPEYLTSLTSLGNTLASLNPTAGTQLFSAILECSKKDNQQPVFPQQQQNLCTNYMDIGEFMMNIQRQQQQQQHQQQQQQQRMPQFPSYDGSLGHESGLLDELNLRMFLGASNSQASQVHHQHQQNLSKPAVGPQDLMSSSHNAGQGFLTEHQILAAATAAGAAQNPLLQMWMPSSSVAANSQAMLSPPPPPHTPQLHAPQGLQNSGVQWTAGGPLVGMPNVINEHLDASNHTTTPSSMWNPGCDVAQVRVTSEQVKSSFKEENAVKKSPEQQSSTTDDEQSPHIQRAQQQMDQEFGLKTSNQDEESNTDNEKQQFQGVMKKPKQNVLQTLAAPKSSTKDDFKKVDPEEKRRQKEERKRLQLEEEKRRALQLEEERRKQSQEEQERQKQIQAQRRKALLGNNNATTNSMSNAKGSKAQSSSVAPWSSQTTATAATTGPGLAEIQKAERRERRADQQRQMEMLEKQVRLNIALQESNESSAMPKWNSAPVQVKSIAEIQAEEAKRLNAEAHFEAQRRKEFELQAALNMANTNNNKNWGSPNPSASSGFWDESSKYKTNASNSSGASFAAAISAGGKQQQPSSGNAFKQQPPQPVSSANTSRNLKKSQTVSVMQSSTVNNSAPQKAVKGEKGSQGNASSGPPTSGTSKPNVASNKAMSTDKRSVVTSKSISNVSGGGGGGNSGIKDDYEHEFINWCMKSLSNMSTKVDVPTFVTFLRDLESPYEVKDYIRMYLGESKEFNDFGKQFLERRSRYKNLQRAQNAHNDDMCKPAPAITPSSSSMAGNDGSENKSKQKKVKKSKMTKLDARILGFSVTAAEGRINVGDRDYVNAP